jgi:hypothetical protein
LQEGTGFFMQISPSSALLQTISSLPAQAGTANAAAIATNAEKAPERPVSASQPPALAAANKALASRQALAQATSQAPASNVAPPRDTPRGSLVNIVV